MTDDNLKFEDAIVKLESLIKDIESGSLSLEDTMSRYSDGEKLIAYCKEKLSSAEQIIKHHNDSSND